MITQKRSIEIYPDKESLSLAAAKKVIEVANSAIAINNCFAIALAGGSTPKRLYELLASEQFSTQTDWSKWHIFIGDERLVPATDPNSNFGMARDSLLSKVPIPEENIYAVNTAHGEMAAQEYENTLRKAVLDLGINGLDVVLLGLGSDGHTLSLFPGKAAVLEKNEWVVATEHGVLPPPVDRISITIPVVQAARLALFLVAGDDKAEVTQQILEQDPNIVRPASMIIPTDNLSVCWMIDQAASVKLTTQ